MRRFFRSALARTALVVLLAPQITACYVIHPEPLQPQMNAAHVVGLVMHNGERIEFTHDGMTVNHDTIYAVGTKGQVIAATADVDSVLVKNLSVEKTTITVLVVGALLALFYVLFSHSAGVKYN